jgi:cysteine desulfuration protein SufE
MPGIPPKLSQLLEKFAAITDRAERIMTLIEFGSCYVHPPARIARRPFPATHRVPDCEADIYVWTEDLPDGTLKFHFAVENPQGISAKAAAAILDHTLSGAPLHQVARVTPEIIETIFGRELTKGKNLGLVGMVNMVRAAAQSRCAAIQKATMN